MLFKKAADVPDAVKKAGLKDWYSALSEKDKVILNRYLGDADTSSVYGFMSSVADSAVRDENYAFSLSICEECLLGDITNMQRFLITEMLIESCVGVKRYDDAKARCESNLLLYPKISSEYLSMNGGKLPEKICCRNRYVDVLVGIESAYDETFALLERFLEMGMISEEEMAFRTQSLKIHRLQRSFDGIYTYDYVK